MLRMTAQTILVAILALGAPKASAPAFADAIARHARTADEAAFLVAWAEHESHFQERIVRNDCKRYECDRGRARGAWQLHRGAAGQDWDALPGNLDAQARSAARMARWALRECKAPLGAFRRLGGLGCDRALKGEDARMASFKKARGML